MGDRQWEMDQLAFDYAWKWFDLHAKQRMQLFYFFLIITGILVNAYVNAYEARLPLMIMAVCSLGLLQAVGFIFFDWRSRELVSLGENLLEHIERNVLDLRALGGSKSPPEGEVEAGAGKPPGILMTERMTRMREGEHRGCAKLRKMKFWIRAMEILVAIGFLGGLYSAFTVRAAADSSETPSAVHQLVP